MRRPFNAERPSSYPNFGLIW